MQPQRRNNYNVTLAAGFSSSEDHLLEELIQERKRGSHYWKDFDFRILSDNAFLKLFPNSKDHRRGKMLPPMSHRRTLAQIREFKRLGQKDQQILHNRYSEQQQQQQSTQRKSRTRRGQRDVTPHTDTAIPENIIF